MNLTVVERRPQPIDLTVRMNDTVSEAVDAVHCLDGALHLGCEGKATFPSELGLYGTKSDGLPGCGARCGCSAGR